MNFVLISSEVRMRQHLIVATCIKIYAITVISWLPPLISQLFFILAILNSTAPFLQRSRSSATLALQALLIKKLQMK